jgi:hypothetical protein
MGRLYDVRTLPSTWGSPEKSEEHRAREEVNVEAPGTGGYMSSFAQDLAGEIYVVYLETGTISRIDPE